MTIKLEDLPTVYNAKETEEDIYKFWEDNEFFKADNKSLDALKVVLSMP